MNLKTKLAAGIIMLAGVSAVQATTFNVDAMFNEPMVNGSDIAGDTRFVGSFDWDGSSLTNFTGRMNESMQGAWQATGMDYVDGAGAMIMVSDGNGGMTMIPDPNAPAGGHMLTLGTAGNNDGQGIVINDTGSRVTATIFKNNDMLMNNGAMVMDANGNHMHTADTDVYYGNTGTDGALSGFRKYGFEGTPATLFQAAVPADGNTANENAFFTLVFDYDANGITSLGVNTLASNAGLVNDMIYGDCTLGSLMQNTCMAGEITGSSAMAGTALSLAISEVSAVPVPAAAWLFGGALMSLFGANRRKSVLPA